MTGNLAQPAAEWLAEQFEFEWCAECGRDQRHHTAIPFMGNWFAKCDLPPVMNGEELVVDPEGYEAATRDEVSRKLRAQGYVHAHGDRYAKTLGKRKGLAWAKVVEEPNGGFGIQWL